MNATPIREALSVFIPSPIVKSLCIFLLFLSSCVSLLVFSILRSPKYCMYTTDVRRETKKREARDSETQILKNSHTKEIENTIWPSEIQKQNEETLEVRSKMRNKTNTHRKAERRRHTIEWLRPVALCISVREGPQENPEATLTQRVGSRTQKVKQNRVSGWYASVPCSLGIKASDRWYALVKQEKR